MIYAAGDICSPYQFTHAAYFMARVVIQNALFKGRKKSSALVMAEEGIQLDTFHQDLGDVDRAILDGEEDGFVKIYVKRGADTIVGATIIASHAGDMSEITLAMTHGLGLKQIGSTIHPYPAQAEAIRKLGDQFSRTRLTLSVKRLFNKWLSWTR